MALSSVLPFRSRLQHGPRSLCAAVCAVLIAASVFPGLGEAQTQGDTLKEAHRLLETPSWMKAEDLVRAVLTKHPDSLDAHATLGLILYRKHEPRASMEEYVAASRLGDLSSFDLRIFALDCAAIPDYPEAEKWLLRAIAHDEKDAANWEALGHVRFAQQQFQGAIDALNQALELSPRSVPVETLIGLSQERMAHLDEAQAAYRQAIAWQAERSGKDAVPLVGLARVLLANDDAKDAIPYLEQAVATPNASSEAHELLGLAYTRTGRAKDAVTELEKAVHLDPGSARLHLMLARVYRMAGSPDKANEEQAEYTRLKAGSAQ